MKKFFSIIFFLIMLFVFIGCKNNKSNIIVEEENNKSNIIVEEERQKLKIIAHRGFNKYYEPNSIEAFIDAGQKNVWAIETDVRKTADNVLVCSHDDNLLNSLGVNICISKVNYNEIKDIPLINNKSSNTQYIALFEDYLKICKQYDSIAFIDLKNDICGYVYKLLLEYDMTNQCVISSQQISLLKKIRSYDENIFIHKIFATNDEILEMSKLKSCGVSIKDYDFSSDNNIELISYIHSLGIKVCFRAANDVDTVKKMIELNIDYIPSDCIYKID